MTDSSLPSRPPVSSWPQSLPKNNEETIISVVCGNTRLHWCAHDGVKNGMSARVLWRTNHLSTEDFEPSNVLSLGKYLPLSTHDYIFGPGKKSTFENAVNQRALARTPSITVYLVSSNADQRDMVYKLFQSVPSRVFWMQGDDFYTERQGRYSQMGIDRLAAVKGAATLYGVPALVFDGGTATTYTATDERGDLLGGGIGPGLRSKLRTLSDYATALPVIRPDEVMDRINKAINNDEPLPVFASNTREAILVDVLSELAYKGRGVIKHWMEQVAGNQRAKSKEADKSEGGKNAKTAKAVVAEGDKKKAGEEEHSTANATDTSTGEKLNESSEKKSTKPTGEAAATPSTETGEEGKAKENEAGAASATKDGAKNDGDASASGTKEQLKKPGDKEEAAIEEEGPTFNEEGMLINKDNVVVVTGGDGDVIWKLLTPNHQRIVHMAEPSQDGLGSLEIRPEYKVKLERNIVHIGIAAAVMAQVKKFNTFGENHSTYALIGQRVAKVFETEDEDGDNVFRGTISFLVEDAGEEEYFKVVYDDGDREDVTIPDLQAMLALYARVGEKVLGRKNAKKRKKFTKEELQRQKEAAAEAAKLIAEKIGKEAPAKDKESERLPAMQPESQKNKKATLKPSDSAENSPTSKAESGKKRPATSVEVSEKSPGDKKRRKKEKIMEPKDYIGKRVGKDFDGEIYFGTVDEYYTDVDDGVTYWHVRYDDSDEEDYEKKDLLDGLSMYKKYKKDDPNPVVPESITKKYSSDKTSPDIKMESVASATEPKKEKSGGEKDTSMIDID